MPVLDYAALASAELHRSPFDYLIVPRFVREEARSAIAADFPEMTRPGSFPVSELGYGPAFRALLEELQGPELARELGEKLGLDLLGRPTMVTVRGRARAKDGRIHRDSRTKIVTVLVYLNSEWTHPGGRLRLLRSAVDLEDFVAEIPPENGNMVAFRCGEDSWHGHAPFVGERRSVQLNWVTSASVVEREQSRHRFSARVKKLFPFA